MHSEPDELNIGAKIRKMRKARHISLQQLANDTGMSYSYLSALENDKHSISINNLQRIASYFNVDMVHFLETRKTTPVFISRDEFGDKTGMEAIYNVITSERAQNLQVSYVSLPPNSPGENHPHRHTRGEEYILVLSGQAFVVVDDERYELHEGDSVFFDSTCEHVIFTGDQPAKLIIVSSPPKGRGLDD